MVHINLANMVLDNQVADDAFIQRKKPDWLRAKLPGGKGYKETRDLVDKFKLHTVCESAKCPNMGECWERGTATMMILGDVCTRACGFCHIKTGKPPEYDLDEPRRVGEAARLMNLKHIVLTSVNRDELPDGGAEIWAEVIREIRQQSPGTHVEVLIPDFEGDWDALQLVLDERPEILAHNLESVPRLYPAVRPQAKYDRSIELLRRAKEQGLTVKTGIMVGIGERDEEITQLIHDVVDGTRVPNINADQPATNRDAYPLHLTDRYRAAREGLKSNLDHDELPFGSDAHQAWRRQHLAPQPAQQALAEQRISEVAAPNVTYPGIHDCCDILTIGQYLQPTRKHLPISHWVTPAQFIEYKQRAEEVGFRHCESGPMVRSSYHADEQVLKMEARVSP